MIDTDRLSWALSVRVLYSLFKYFLLLLFEFALDMPPLQQHWKIFMKFCFILLYFTISWMFLTDLTKVEMEMVFSRHFWLFSVSQMICFALLVFLVVVVILLHVAKQINVAVCCCGALGAIYRTDRWVAFNGNHSENGTAKSRTARKQWRWLKTVRGGKNIK